MSTEVTANRYLTNDDYYAALSGVAAGLTGGGNGKAFMKFDGNDGEFSFGSENTELLPGTQLILNPKSFKMGWVIWKNKGDGNKVVYEVMHDPVLQGPPPNQNALPDHGPYLKGEGPSEQYTVEFALTEAPFTEMVLQGNNNSKRRALSALMKDFGGSFRLHPDKMPIVEIDAREFSITVDGRKAVKFAPNFKIVNWVDEAELIAMKEGTPEDYEATEVATEQQALPAPAESKAAPTGVAGTTAAAKPRARGRF